MSSDIGSGRVFVPRLLLAAALISAVCLLPAARSLRFDGGLDALMPSAARSRPFDLPAPAVFPDASLTEQGATISPSEPAPLPSRVAQQLRTDVIKLSAAAATIALVAATLCLRSLPGVLLTALCLAVGLVWSVAAIAVTGRPVTLPTAGVIPLLPLIGLAFPVYFLARVQQYDEGGTDRMAAAGNVLARLRVPLGVLAGAATLGAVVHLVSDIPASRDFGIFAGLGITSMGMAALIVGPAGAASWLPPGGPAVSQERALLHSRRIERIGAAAVRRGWVLGFGGCALAIAGAVGFSRFGNAADFQSLLGNLAAATSASSAADLGTWSVRIESREPRAVERLETLVAIADLQRFIAAHDGVISTHSLLDLIAEIPSGKNRHALPATQQEVAKALRIEHETIAHVVDADFSNARILVRTEGLDTARFNTLTERIAAFARGSGWLGQKDRFPPGITVSAEGRLVDFHQGAPRMKAEVVRPLGAVAVILFGVVSVLFLSGRIGFFVVVLNLLAMIAVIGLTAWIGVGTNVFTAPLPSLLLGLAVGHTAYYYRALGADGRTLDCPTEALTLVVQSTGRPLAYSVLALVAGFALIATAEAPALRWFGAIGAGGLALAFAANLFLLSSRVLNARVITMAEFLTTRLGRIEEILLFDGMRPFQAKLVVLSGRVATAATGAPMARRGEESSELYLLLSGQADVRKGADGPVVGSVKRGDVVGEMGLVRKAPRSADVIATEPVEYLVLDGDFLQRLRRQYPRTAAVLLFNLTRILSDRLDRATERVTALEAGN